MSPNNGDGLLSPAESPLLVTPTLPTGPPSPLLVGPSTQKNSWYSSLFGPKAVSISLFFTDQVLIKADVHVDFGR